MTGAGAAPLLVLASASSARLSTLRAAGVDPVVRVADIDEAATVAAAGLTRPSLVVALLARAKANDVAARARPLQIPTGAIVLGCDSVLELDGAALGKPVDANEARRRWRRMRGRTGILHTGHSVTGIGHGRTADGTSSTRVHFADLDDHEIDAYVATGEPLGVAGAFTVDGFGGPFVTGIEGDYHGVVGVSLPLVRLLLARIGVNWVDLWRQPPALSGQRGDTPEVSPQN